MTQDNVDITKMEIIHRMGPPPNATGNGNYNRRIVCKFNMFTDREATRKSGYNLKGTNYYVTEQFPLEVSANRRVLARRMKEEKEKVTRPGYLTTPCT